MNTLRDEKNTGTLKFTANPIIKRMEKIKKTSTECATYRGVALKCFFFVIMMTLGIAVALLMHTLPLPGFTAIGMQFSYIEVITAASMLVLSFVTPIVAVFARCTIPVTGTLYCFGIGYIFTFLANAIVKYRSPILLAVIITLVLVAVLMAIYSSGKIKVSSKFRTVVTTLFLVSIILGLLLTVCMFIPGLKEIVAFIFANKIFCIICALAGVVIATLFLIVDFDAVHKAVENKLPKEYEWMGAFALMFSVIWLFLKVFQLIAIINGKN